MGFLFCLFLFGVFVCLGFWFVLGLFVFLFVWFCFSFVDTLEDEWAEEYESVGAFLSDCWLSVYKLMSKVALSC